MPETCSVYIKEAREEEAIYTSYKERKRASQAGRLYASSRLGTLAYKLSQECLHLLKEFLFKYRRRATSFGYH